MSRYQRQICLAEVGKNGQANLANASVLVVGAGGLGCAVLPYLVCAGVGHIHLVDGDFVSLSNLPRQVLYRETDIGLPKVECAQRHLALLNKDCKITTQATALTPSNVIALGHYEGKKVDLVMDCADNFAVSYTLSDFCHQQSIPLVSASALGFHGYIGGFCGEKPSLRAVFPELPQRAQNCSNAGIMGPVVGTIGCIQAQFALNILLNIQPSPLGQLMSIDLKDLRQSGFRFDDAPEPPAQQLLRFVDSNHLTQGDWVVDLRAESTPRDSKIHYFSLDDFQQHKPQPSVCLSKQTSEQSNKAIEEHSIKTKKEHSKKIKEEHLPRAVIVCRTGLTAWRAARMLQDYWQGEICLMAMGDDPLLLRQ